MKVSKLPITKLQKSPQCLRKFSLWCFTQFGVLLSPIALKVLGPLLLDSNSSRDGTNPLFQFPIWQLTTNRVLTTQNFKDYSTIKAMKST